MAHAMSYCMWCHRSYAMYLSIVTVGCAFDCLHLRQRRLCRMSLCMYTYCIPIPDTFFEYSKVLCLGTWYCGVMFPAFEFSLTVEWLNR